LSLTKILLRIAKDKQDNHKKDHEAIEAARQRRIQAQRNKKGK
jgi:hypothetical protein